MTRKIIKGLKRFHDEWQEVADAEGVSLNEIKGSVGRILNDVMDAADLTDEEKKVITGENGIIYKIGRKIRNNIRVE